MPESECPGLDIGPSEAAVTENQRPDDAPASAPLPSNLVPLLDTMGGAVRLCLFLRAENLETETELAAAADLFCRLGGNSRSATVYKAGLFDGRGQLIVPLALKLRLDPVSERKPRRASSNRATETDDSTWRESLKLGMARAAAPTACPKHYSFGESADDGGNSWIAGRLYCRHRRILFRPRSPESLSPLEDCRDDALLTEVGLPPYSRTGPRFLYSPMDAAGGSVRFYSTAAGSVQADNCPVGSVEECIRDQGLVVGASESVARADPELDAELQRAFPCYECDEAATCYPGGEGYPRAIDRVVPFSFHDFQIDCSELYDLQADEFADCLGGRPLGAWAESLRSEGTTTDNSHRLEIIEKLAAMPRLFLFDDVRTRTGLLEVVWLKWRLLSLAMEQLAGLHSAFARPHLYLSARHVLVRVTPESASAPAYWGLRVGLLGLGHAIPVKPIEGLTSTLVRPPATPEPHYASSALLQSPDNFGRGGVACVRIDEVTTDQADVGGPRLLGRLTDPGLGLATIGATDLVRIRLPGRSGKDPIEFWCRPSAEYAANSLTYEGVAVSTTNADDLGSYADSTFEGVEYTHYPAYGLADDLYGIGVLFLRVLFVNSEQDLKKVVNAAQEVVRLWAEACPDVRGTRRVPGVVMDLLAGTGWNIKNVLYKPPADLDPSITVDLRRLWDEVVLVGLRLLGGSACFAYAHNARTREDAVRVLGEITDEFVRVRRYIEAGLFQDAACPGGLAEVIGTVLGGAAEAPQDGGARNGGSE